MFVHAGFIFGIRSTTHTHLLVVLWLLVVVRKNIVVVEVDRRPPHIKPHFLLTTTTI